LEVSPHELNGSLGGRRNKKYVAELEESGRSQLPEIDPEAEHAARKIGRAQTLLSAGEGRSDEEIAETLKAGLSTAGGRESGWRRKASKPLPSKRSDRTARFGWM
jgi:hypothetical protein